MVGVEEKLADEENPSLGQREDKPTKRPPTRATTNDQPPTEDKAAEDEARAAAEEEAEGKTKPRPQKSRKPSTKSLPRMTQSHVPALPLSETQQKNELLKYLDPWTQGEALTQAQEKAPQQSGPRMQDPL